MSTIYTYNKSPVDIDSLVSEIKISSIGDTYLSYCSFNKPDDLSIAFDVELSLGEKSVLDNIVSNHLGIHKYVDNGYIVIADGNGGFDFISPGSMTTGSGIINIDGGSAFTVYDDSMMIDGGGAFD